MPAVALNVAADVKVMPMLMMAAGRYTLYWLAFATAPVRTIDLVPLAWAAVNTKLLPALVIVLPTPRLSATAPESKAYKKLALVTAAPVTVIPVQAPPIARASVPVDVCGLMFARAPVNVLHVVTVTEAVGMPLKTTLLADVDETVVVTLKPRVTVAAPVPKRKLLEVADMDAVVAVMRLVPVSGPNIDTPKPADVIVDEMTVSPVADAAPT